MIQGTGTEDITHLSANAPARYAKDSYQSPARPGFTDSEDTGLEAHIDIIQKGAVKHDA